MRTAGSVLATVVLAGLLSGCALRSPSIADLHHNPIRYHDRTVTVSGVVTSSWGVPVLPYRIYRIDDGTGQVTVLSRGGRTPTRGAHVRVRGRVNELGVIGGRPLGLHIQEHRLDIRRR